MNTKIPQNLFIKAFTRDKKINHKFQILQNVRETVKCRGVFSANVKDACFFDRENHTPYKDLEGNGRLSQK